MTFKDILVYADGNSAAAGRLDVACNLAQLHGAHLTALHARLPPFFAFDMALGTNEIVMRWQEEYRQEAERQARKAVEAATSRNGVSIDLRVMHVDSVAALQHLARVTDLVVLSQGRTPVNSPEAFDFIPTPEEVVMRLPCPLLVVPRQGNSAAPGRRIVVGWKSSRESARAVRDALPLLVKADTVTVVEVREEEDEAYLSPGSDLAVHLSRHGVHAELVTVRGVDAAAGELLLAEVARLKADLLVTGAYGHSRLKELVLGGVTRHLMRNSPVPVFFSH